MKNNSNALKGFLICAVLGVIVYLNALPSPFIYDDVVYVQRNPQIRTISPAAVFSPFSPYAAGLYRPVTTLSYALDYKIAGLSAPWFHTSNILLHAAASGLLFLVAFALIGSWLPAVFAGAIFAVHPVHTEAVTWVSGRSEVLAGLFVLLSLLFYLRSRDRLSATAYFFGLLSKEIAAPLIFVLPLIRRRPLSEYSPYFTSLIVYFLFRVTALGSLTVPMEHIRTAGLSFLERMNLMIPVVAHYVRLMVWPVGLRLEYDWIHFSVLVTVLAAFVLAVIISVGIGLWKRGDTLIAIGIAWFFLFLLPVLNIIPIGEFIAERFLYLPSIGFCLLIGVVVHKLEKHRRSVILGFLSILSLFFILSILRNADWRTPETLWVKTLELSPNAPHALQNLAGIKLAEGELSEAQQLISRGVANWPNEPVLSFIGAQIYESSGELEKSTAMYEEALKLSSDDPFSMTHLQKGVASIKIGRLYEALEYFEKARGQNQYDPPVWNNLGIVYARLGKVEEALDAFDRAIELYEGLEVRSVEEERGYRGAVENKGKVLGVIGENN